MHVHFSQIRQAVANGNAVRVGLLLPAAVTAGRHVDAARRHRPTGCTANALLMNWCPNQGGMARRTGNARIRSCAQALRCMTGMTSTGVQAVQFGLGLARYRLDGMHVHTNGYLDLPRSRGHRSAKDTHSQRATRVGLSALYRLI